MSGRLSQRVGAELERSDARRTADAHEGEGRFLDAIDVLNGANPVRREPEIGQRLVHGATERS